MFKYVAFRKVPTEHTVLGFIGATDDNKGIKVHRFSVDVVSIQSDDEIMIDELIASQPEEIGCVEITLDEFKTAVSSSAQVKRIYDVLALKLSSMLQDVKNKYPLEERETWAIQKEEANKYQASKLDSDAPFLKVLADADGDTVANFAAAVLEKNNLFTEASAYALSEKRRVQAELLAELGII
jgi:hypothetical protein